MPRQKEKLEIDALKTSLNLKNLELESISGEYEEAQKVMASAERKIADLELTVSLLERRLETEREQVHSFKASAFLLFNFLFNIVAIFRLLFLTNNL